MKYLATLKPTRLEVQASYEERIQRCKEGIESLQEDIKILSSSKRDQPSHLCGLARRLGRSYNSRLWM